MSPTSQRNSEADLTDSSQLAEKLLSHVQASRDVVQDFVPLHQSLEWTLGQDYFRSRGNKAFLEDSTPVPFLINNDGTLSRHAAEVFFANLVEADNLGTLGRDIVVLEIGIGVGLFARFFLDAVRELSNRHKKNYYDRLIYVAADRSRRMLSDLQRHGVLNRHPGRFCVREIDATRPAKLFDSDPLLARSGPTPLRAVFLNYLLDCLPAAVLQIDGDNVRELCVRTCISRNVKLQEYTPLSLAGIRDRVKRNDERSRKELLEVYGLFASEYDFQTCDLGALPFGTIAFDFARTRSKRSVLNFGAIQCLSELVKLLTPDGFILMNEYGVSTTEVNADFEHQRFSLATAIGLNFPLLEYYFSTVEKLVWLEAPGDSERGIHSRLLGKSVGTETRVTFVSLFQKYHLDGLQAPIVKARQCVNSGRFELASAYYQSAVRLQPSNWLLLGEVSSFLTTYLHDAKAGVDFAMLALSFNPTCAPDLWNSLGDALFQLGRHAEATSAYNRALLIGPNNVYARFKLSAVLLRMQKLRECMAVIMDGLILDKTEQFREKLLLHLQQLLSRMSAYNQKEYSRMSNLISKTAKEHTRPDLEDGNV
jgi:tetratricopeptide (TPR) repeat protein